MAAYTGRFAPSPTGPLHLGSLVAGLASFLDARAAGGRWLLRIEDLDPPREQPGADDLIMRTLDAHGFEWDDAPLWQHSRLDAYSQALLTLRDAGHVYPCVCARKSFTGVYPGRCRGRTFAETPGPYAVRMRVPEGAAVFDDRFLGPQRMPWTDVGDFIVRRKDTLFAYQLAVVVDDAAAGVTHVIRGNDLLDSTPRQLALFDALREPAPTFGHSATVVHADGAKLSKQTGAAALDNRVAGASLLTALRCLGQDVRELSPDLSPRQLLTEATVRWDPGRVGFARHVSASGAPVR